MTDLDILLSGGERDRGCYQIPSIAGPVGVVVPGGFGSVGLVVPVPVPGSASVNAPASSNQPVAGFLGPAAGPASAHPSIINVAPVAVVAAPVLPPVRRAHPLALAPIIVPVVVQPALPRPVAPVIAPVVSPPVFVPGPGTAQSGMGKLLPSQPGSYIDLTGVSPGAIASGKIPPVAELPVATVVPVVSEMATQPVLSRLVQALGLEQAGAAGLNLLRGNSLTAPEFGALAGTVIGAFVGQPSYGAKVGLTVGEGIQTLNSLSEQYYGRSLDDLLTGAAKSVYARISGQLGMAPVPSLAPLQSQPTTVPGGGLPVEGPQTGIPVTPSVPIFTVGQRGLIPSEPGYPPSEVPQTVPVTNQAGCSPEVLALVEEISRCPPEALQRLFDHFEITQRPGQKPQISVKEQVCLCCESVGDYQSYIETGGRMGNCVQVKPGDGALVNG